MPASTQSYSNHTRWDPLFHFVLMPLLTVVLIAAIVSAYRFPSLRAVGVIALCLGVVLTAFKARLYALKVQNRLICLEEKLRMAAVLPATHKAHVDALTPTQLVGLRFAADEELATLVERAATKKLSRADIKKAIVKWRADEYRV